MILHSTVLLNDSSSGRLILHDGCSVWNCPSLSLWYVKEAWLTCWLQLLLYLLLFEAPYHPKSVVNTVQFITEAFCQNNIGSNYFSGSYLVLATTMNVIEERKTWFLRLCCSPGTTKINWPGSAHSPGFTKWTGNLLTVDLTQGTYKPGGWRE